MSDLIVATDEDANLTAAGKQICDWIGAWLAQTYPGYRWRVEPHPDPLRPFVDIRLEEAGAAIELTTDCHGEERAALRLPGYAVRLWEHYSVSSLKAEVLRAGGTLLEAFNYSRRAFNPAELANAPRRAGFLILPTL